MTALSTRVTGWSPAPEARVRASPSRRAGPRRAGAGVEGPTPGRKGRPHLRREGGAGDRDAPPWSFSGMRLPGPGKRTGGRWKPGAARPRPAPPGIKGQVAGDVVGAWASPPLWAIARFGEADLLQQVSERAGVLTHPTSVLLRMALGFTFLLLLIGLAEPNDFLNH